MAMRSTKTHLLRGDALQAEHACNSQSSGGPGNENPGQLFAHQLVVLQARARQHHARRGVVGGVKVGQHLCSTIRITQVSSSTLSKPSSWEYLRRSLPWPRRWPAAGVALAPPPMACRSCCAPAIQPVCPTHPHRASLARTRVEAAQAAVGHNEGAAQPAGVGHRVQPLQQRGLGVVRQVLQVSLHLADLRVAQGAKWAKQSRWLCLDI